MNPGRDKDMQRAIGRCSGFPECCIDFYLGPWSTMSQGARNKNFNKRPHAGYVQCPKCQAAGPLVRIRTCHAGCGCPLGRYRAQHPDAAGSTCIAVTDIDHEGVRFWNIGCQLRPNHEGQHWHGGHFWPARAARGPAGPT